MEFEEGGAKENVTQMATRLMRVLDYQKEMLSLKRRYALERWPENLKRHKLIGLPTEGCVPESFIRDEKEFSDMNLLIRTAIATLCAHGSKDVYPTKYSMVDQFVEPPLSRVQEMSNLEAIKHVPGILCSLNKHALKTLFFTLNGRQSTTNHRYILEREIKKAFAKLEMPSGEGGMPEMLMKMASVVRSRSSYRHTLGSANPNVNFIPTMPSCALAAARKAFACVRNFPTRIVMEVGKLLIMERDTNPSLCFRYKTHSRTVDAVIKEFERVMDNLRENDPLSAPLEGALHVISLSARILLGNDGGLAGVLKPLPAEKLAMERDFSTAYNQIQKLDEVDLLGVYDILGKGAVQRLFKKHRYIDELQRLLVDSMSCIYVCDGLPGHVKEVIQMINNTIDTKKQESNTEKIGFQERKSGIYKLSKKVKRAERVNAEIDAALNVSAALQNVVWELYNNSYGHRHRMAGERTTDQASNDAEPSSSNIKISSVDTKMHQYLSNLIPHLDRPSGEGNQDAVKMEMETVEDEGPDVAAADCMALGRVQPDIEHYAQDVESFSDEAAKIVYVLIGCLLKENAMPRSFLMDHTTVGYLQTGFDKLQDTSAFASNLPGSNNFPGCSEKLQADELVLRIAKQLKGIPKSVISEVELQMKL